MGDEQQSVEEGGVFGAQVVVTAQFLGSWRALSPQMQQVVRRKIALLAECRRHPSLRAHPVLRHNGAVWECAITRRHRLLYRWYRGKLWLFEVGGHRVVDRCHLRNFSAGEAPDR